MKVGDLVRHKRFGVYYLIAKLDESALVGIIQDSGFSYIHKNWIEVISESR